MIHLSSITISRDTKKNGSHRSQHKHKRDTPSAKSCQQIFLTSSMRKAYISVFVFPNVFAKSVTVSETVKKSKASQLHAKNATRKNIHCWKLSSAKALIGLGALFMGGFSDETRVAMYLTKSCEPLLQEKLCELSVCTSQHSSSQALWYTQSATRHRELFQYPTSFRCLAQ